MYIYEILEIVIRIFLMILGLFAVYYFIFYNKRKNIESKRKETIEFFFKDKINYEKIIINNRKTNHFGLETNENEERILEILAVFEKLAISIKTRVFDKEVLLEYYGKYMIHFYQEFKYFILKRREESGNPYLFIEYEKLVSQIKSDLNYKTQNYYE